MPTPEELDTFLAADDRARKQLLKDLFPRIETAEEVRVLAPALRDPSPRVAARVTSLLAKFGLEEELERQLVGLKPGKVQLLRGQFQRLMKDRGTAS